MIRSFVIIGTHNGVWGNNDPNPLLWLFEEGLCTLNRQVVNPLYIDNGRNIDKNSDIEHKKALDNQ